MSFHFCGYDQSHKFTIHMWGYVFIYIYTYIIYMWGSFPGTFGNKCLFKFWMLIGFDEDVSLKNHDWFSKTLKPTKCFFKECQKCFLLKNANARPACGPKKWPSETIFYRAQAPSFCNGTVEGDQNSQSPKHPKNQCGSKTGKPCKNMYIKAP